MIETLQTKEYPKPYTENELFYHRLQLRGSRDVKRLLRLFMKMLLLESCFMHIGKDINKVLSMFLILLTPIVQRMSTIHHYFPNL